MQQSTPKILIISSDTGGGHRSAAQAIADGFQKFWKGESAAVRTIKAVEDSHHVTEKLVNLYNWVLQHKQHWGYAIHYAGNRLMVLVKKQPPVLNIQKLKIAIDAGHGGTNTGAEGNTTGIAEKKYTLLFANALQKYLKIKGVKISTPYQNFQT